MFYGIVGAHRTGKSTLARAFAERMGWAYFPTNVQGFMAKQGLSSQKDAPFAERMKAQQFILDQLLESYVDAAELCQGATAIVVDRTPLDVLGYTMSEVLRESVTFDTALQLERHERQAYAACNAFFMGMTFVYPGIPLVADPGKGTANRFYQRHISACMVEAACDDRLDVPVHFLPHTLLENQSRVSEAFVSASAIMSSRNANADRATRTTH